MKPNTLRRQFVLGSAALLAQAGLSRSVLADLLKPGGVPAVDNVTVKVLIDSTYDTTLPGTSKWIKIKRTPFVSQTDVRKTLHNEWGLSLSREWRIVADT